MKKGFTLAELLLTLGIIGIAAAVMAPMVGNLIPDKNKGMVLKVYNAVSRINEEMLNNPSLYSSDGACDGLSCTDAPDDPKYSSYSGSSKYGNLLAGHLNLNFDVDEDGEAVYDSVSDSGGTVSFKTSDGISWTVTTGSIIVDVDPDSTNNCYYGQSGCKAPDTFKFIVDNDGRLEGDDPLTKAYLVNPDKMNSKKEDFAYAKAHP